MKRLVGSLVLGTMLLVGAGQAQAELLTNWTYNLTKVSLNNPNTDFVTSSGEDISFTSGGYNIDLAPGATTSGNLTFPGADTSASSSNEDKLVNQTTASTEVFNTSATKLADLVFSYSAVSVDNPNVRMSVTYTLPLYTYYDANAATAYIYYNNSEVGTMGATAITHDGYKYGVTGFGLFVDGRALENFSGAEGDPNLYSGWAINDDTMSNYYDEYVVGGDANVSTGEKTGDAFGAYTITGIFSIANSLVPTPPAPTPEPATMLLMGAGLAGLGFVKRRRQA